MLDPVSTQDTLFAGLANEVVPPAHPCPTCGKETKEEHPPGFRTCKKHGPHLVDYDKLREAWFALVHEKISLQSTAGAAYALLEEERAKVAALETLLRTRDAAARLA